VCADDTAFDVLAVGGHVRFARLEIVVRLDARWRPSHRRDDVLSVREVGSVRVFDDADGLVSEDQPVVSVGNASVVPVDDLVIGPVNTDATDPHERFAGGGFRNGSVDDLRDTRSGLDCDGLHCPR